MTSKQWTNAIGMTFADIPAGDFRMGAQTDEVGADYDEYPRHPVRISHAFGMAVTPVTNAQYEQFDPDHRQWRGYLGFSEGDDEAVVQVSWHEAVAFCDWLSASEGQTYRLPTEAEWEYAARAGSHTAYWTGDDLPEVFHRNQRETWYPDPTHDPYDVAAETPSLAVGQSPPNSWGLNDVNGLVEEWCLDWYGPYSDEDHVDPVGYARGDFRVTRGGSHSTPTRYLRSANRSGSLPDDRSWLIGFRVVCGDWPQTVPLQVPLPPAVLVPTPRVEPVLPGGDAPFFVNPIPFVRMPEGVHGPLFSHHNHCPSIVECPNGDLLAIWFSCEAESGREMTLAGSRVRRRGTRHRCFGTHRIGT